MGLLDKIKSGAYLRQGDVVKIKPCRLVGSHTLSFIDTPAEYEVVAFHPSKKSLRSQVCEQQRDIRESRILGDDKHTSLFKLKQNVEDRFITTISLTQVWTHSVKLKLTNPILTWGVLNHVCFDTLPPKQPFSADLPTHDLFLRPLVVSIPIWLLDSLWLKTTRNTEKNTLLFGERLEYRLGGFRV